MLVVVVVVVGRFCSFQSIAVRCRSNADYLSGTPEKDGAVHTLI